MEKICKYNFILEDNYEKMECDDGAYPFGRIDDWMWKGKNGRKPGRKQRGYL